MMPLFAAAAVAAVIFCQGKGDGKAAETGARASAAVEEEMPEHITPVRSTFTDARDSKTYRTVEINGKVWMAENLNYQTDYSWCYDNKASNCAKYGRLYAWDAAKSACPAGWHLPTIKEWEELSSWVGRGNMASTKIKSKPPDWDGTDDFGFSAKPGGSRNIGGSFKNLGEHSGWWSATQGDDSKAYGMSEYVDWRGWAGYKGLGYSVRCMMDFIFSGKRRKRRTV
jgi:uncharacterized protein (TIGR02145 family)